MKILYIAHRIPYPPNKGDKIRTFHHIRHLSLKHVVHLACLVDDRQDLQHVQTLEKYCATVTAVYRSKTVASVLAGLALLTPNPLSIASFRSVTLQRKVACRLSQEDFDGLILSSSAMAEYVPKWCTVPAAIDFMDVDSEKWKLYGAHRRFPMSWIYGLESRRLARWEEKLAGSFEWCFFVSAEEAKAFENRVNGTFVGVIPNGVDLEYFAPDGRAAGAEAAIVFAGTMDYFPNIDAVKYFCEVVFPLVRVALPDARFYIVGRNPPPTIVRLGRDPNVTVTGTVSDVRPYLANARVAVAPFRVARGIQNKILEAMAMGVPVVGTSTAFEGIRASERNGVRIADHPGRFAREVVRFLENGRVQRECSIEARRYVELHHRWEDSGAQLERFLHAMAGRSGCESRPPAVGA